MIPRRGAQRGHLHLHVQWHLIAMGLLGLLWGAARPGWGLLAWVGAYVALFFAAALFVWPRLHDAEARLARWWARRRQR